MWASSSREETEGARFEKHEIDMLKKIGLHERVGEESHLQYQIRLRGEREGILY